MVIDTNLLSAESLCFRINASSKYIHLCKKTYKQGKSLFNFVSITYSTRLLSQNTIIGQFFLVNFFSETLYLIFNVRFEI